MLRFNLQMPPGTKRLYTICLYLALGSALWGYNIGILSSILAHPGWKNALYSPSPAQKGVVTGIYYGGTLLSYLFVSHLLADVLGRRYSSVIGTGVLAVGALIMASAGGGSAVAVMAFGRFISGLGVGVVSTGVPLYQSEIAPAKDRGRFVTVNHAGFIGGLAMGLWAGYFITFWSSAAGQFWGWRVLILVQLLPAGVFAYSLPRLPESPRWLVEKGEAVAARSVLAALRQGSYDEDDISDELQAIRSSIASRPKSKYSPSIALSLSLFQDPALFARLWRGFLLQFMAQMCGATAMKYYLPTLLKALGLSTQMALLVGALEVTVKISMTLVEMWLIDRFGRKVCLIGGSLVMAIAMLINGALPLSFPNNSSHFADSVCIAFIFIYAMGYSIGLGPAAWVYCSEIFPTSVRARGLNFAASGGSIGSIITSQIWPMGNARFGSGIYFFFMAVNLICVPIVWLQYPETKGKALEEMDALFGQTMSHSPNVALSGGEGFDSRDAQPRPEGEALRGDTEDDPLPL
ncbi:hypothetical protein VHEMI00058 [[Torrubiella] hemipterigena]|uniref:Major facilitator superfamily (MFS) profile domain-containing protein n=1 Tax=[Torrubiella] hemipterigena TaxID=1531966 RepID=A0A0A1SI74_9HYPO|nr:hypothetical protein VHEMI00058 [[Torrubiella] hemipterigena]